MCLVEVLATECNGGPATGHKIRKFFIRDQPLLCLEGTGSSAVSMNGYQRQELKPEQRDAWRLLGEHLEILTGKMGKLTA
ncbi:MAG: hypothetical protein HHJ12_13430 [Glaciimonas sp.]|nr:hypothetical protein [Glaciimonas sp.]